MSGGRRRTWIPLRYPVRSVITDRPSEWWASAGGKRIFWMGIALVFFGQFLFVAAFGAGGVVSQVAKWSGVLLLPGVIFLIWHGHSRFRRWIRVGRCLVCGYDCRGLEPRELFTCPECGSEIEMRAGRVFPVR